MSRVGDPLAVKLGASSRRHLGPALRTQPTSWVVRLILRAPVRGLLPVLEKPEQSTLPDKTKGRKSAPEPGLACPPCLECLWFPRAGENLT